MIDPCLAIAAKHGVRSAWPRQASAALTLASTSRRRLHGTELEDASTSQGSLTRTPLKQTLTGSKLSTVEVKGQHVSALLYAVLSQLVIVAAVWSRKVLLQ